MHLGLWLALELGPSAGYDGQLSRVSRSHSGFSVPEALEGLCDALGGFASHKGGPTAA